MIKQCECILQTSHRKGERQYNTVLGSEIYFDMVANPPIIRDNWLCTIY